MLQRGFFRLSVLLAVVGLVLSSVNVHAQDHDRRGRKYKAPPPSARVEVTVLKADNGKPIENAAVIFHPVEGDRDKGGMELKTNEDGKAMIDVIPVGDTVRLQVIARGFQTYGKDFKIDKDELSMEVRLRRPVPQYSIYKNHSQDANQPNNGSKDGSGSQQQEKQPQK